MQKKGILCGKSQFAVSLKINHTFVGKLVHLYPKVMYNKDTVGGFWSKRLGKRLVFWERS